MSGKDTSTTPTTETCPRCGTPVVPVPTIGPFCPNEKCDAGDDLRPDWQTREPSEAELFFKRLREMREAEEAEILAASDETWKPNCYGPEDGLS